MAPDPELPDDGPSTAAEGAIDAFLGIGRRAYGLGWWALALWTSGSSINVLARAQNWGFHLPFGADFKDVPTGYGVAAYGVFGGGVLLWFVLAGMIVHGATWGRLAKRWPGRIPAAWESISDRVDGPIPRLLQALVLLMAVLLPLYLQVFFVSKFLAGTAVSQTDARVGGAHLAPPVHGVFSYVYDGRDGFAYCEFYEPWAAVAVASTSIALGTIALLCFLLPDCGFANGLARLFDRKMPETTATLARVSGAARRPPDGEGFDGA